jgi:hypothetical protein
MLTRRPGMTRRAFVRLRTTVEGLHRWPDASAPDAYLAAPHRHLFAVEVDLQVHHDDREIEINAAGRWLAELMPTLAGPREPGGPLDFGRQSCEQLAGRIADALLARHGQDRQLRCVMLEDGVLGAGVEWRPESEGQR